MFKIIYENTVSLTEAVKLQYDVEQVLNKYGLTPEEWVKDIKIEPSYNNDKLMKYKDEVKEITMDMKISKILMKLFPKLEKENKGLFNRIIDEIAILNYNKQNYVFEVYDDIGKAYVECDENGVSSCMSKEESLIDFYSYVDDIRVLVLFDEDDDPEHEYPLGRALLWHGINDSDVKYMDRIYPSEDLRLHGHFYKWAKENNYYHRSSQKAKDTSTTFPGSSLSVTVQLPKLSYEDVFMVPYMDTFMYGRLFSGELEMTNEHIGSGYYFNSIMGTVVQDEYEDKEILNDTISLAKIYTSTITNSIITDSSVYDIEMKDSEISGCEIEKSNIVKTKMQNNSLSETNILKSEVSEGSAIKCAFNDCTISEYHLRDSKISNGGITDSKVVGGWISDAEVDSVECIEAVVINCVFNGGTFKSGTWVDGTWKSGTWISGWIKDPDKIGNHKTGWRWNEDYVNSPISPAEYFNNIVKESIISFDEFLKR